MIGPIDSVARLIMMHRLKLREPTGRITPVGPTFSQAAKREIIVDGSVLTLKIPKHAPIDKISPIIPERVYKSDDILFKSDHDNEPYASNFKTYIFLSYHWGYYGPWFTGPRAQLSMYGAFINVVNYKNNNFSLFHPRSFEKVVGDYLVYRYSRYKGGALNNRYKYFAPVNWQPLSRFPVVAVRLEVRPDTTVSEGEREYLVFFPVDDKFFVSFQFNPSLLYAQPQVELEKIVDSRNVMALMENIIDSIELKLSPEAEKKKQKALEGLKDTSLIRDFHPIKWDDAVADIHAPLIENS